MAISLKLADPPSDDEILALSERNPGYQFERNADGQLVVTPTSTEAGRQEAEVLGQLYQWAKADGRGVAFGPSTGFHMPDDALLSPDASWVRRDRWEALTARQQQDYAPLCPDAVFEVASPSDTLANLRKKMRSYLANGARLAVLVDPRRRAVEIFKPDRVPEILNSVRSVACDPVLAGLILHLEPIFSCRDRLSEIDFPSSGRRSKL